MKIWIWLVWVLPALILHSLDAGSTYWFISEGIAGEGNPIVRFFINQFGVNAALLVIAPMAKIVLIIAVSLLIYGPFNEKTRKEKIGIGLWLIFHHALLLIVVLHNFKIIALA